jgi:hypothetical protein
MDASAFFFTRGRREGRVEICGARPDHLAIWPRDHPAIIDEQKYLKVIYFRLLGTK